MDLKQVGTIIERRRKANNLTLDEVAERADIQKPKLAGIESGHIEIKLTELYRLAEAINLTPSDISLIFLISNIKSIYKWEAFGN